MTTYFEIDDEKWAKVKILLESHNNLICRFEKLERDLTELENIMKIIETHTSLREKLDKLEKRKDDMEKGLISRLEKMEELKEENEMMYILDV